MLVGRLRGVHHARKLLRVRRRAGGGTLRSAGRRQLHLRKVVERSRRAVEGRRATLDGGRARRQVGDDGHQLGDERQQVGAQQVVDWYRVLLHRRRTNLESSAERDQEVLDGTRATLLLRSLERRGHAIGIGIQHGADAIVKRILKDRLVDTEAKLQLKAQQIDIAHPHVKVHDASSTALVGIEVRLSRLLLLLLLLLHRRRRARCIFAATAAAAIEIRVTATVGTKEKIDEPLRLRVRVRVISSSASARRECKQLAPLADGGHQCARGALGHTVTASALA